MSRAVSFVNCLPSGIELCVVLNFYVFLSLCVNAVLRTYPVLKKTDVKEQQICIKFCFRLMYGLSVSRKVHMSVDNEERSGRPSTGTTTEDLAEV